MAFGHSVGALPKIKANVKNFNINQAMASNINSNLHKSQPNIVNLTKKEQSLGQRVN